MFEVLRPLYLFLIVSVPLVVVAAPLYLLRGHALLSLAAVAAAPWLYAWSYLFVCGSLSKPFQKYIVPGVFPRDLKDPTYRGRRLYGLCWTCVYYNTPLYHLYLSSPLMKRSLFRLFGYRGGMDFILYPDSWIRDLPLLNFGKGSYIGNRCLIGTNLSSRDGKIIVGPITIGDNCMIGHLAVVGLGTNMAENCELGVLAVTGFMPQYGANTQVSATAIVAHNVELGSNAKIGIAAYVGSNSLVGDNIKVPNAVHIRSHARLAEQSDITVNRIDHAPTAADETRTT